MTVSFSPATPVVGNAVTVSLSITGAHRYELTSKPNASALSLGENLDATGASSAVFTFDAPGTYGVKAYRYLTGYVPAAFASGTGVAGLSSFFDAIETATIEVGEALDLPLASSNGHSLTLRIAASNNSVTSATLVNATTDTATAAKSTPAVTAALAALVGASVTTMGPALVTATEDLRSNYNAHRTNAAHGATSDTSNPVSTDRVYDTTTAIAMLNTLRKTLIAHLTGASTATARWHAADDTLDLPLAASATDRASAIVLLCDLRRRVYERHRVLIALPASHVSADNTNVLSATTLLETLIAAVFDVFASASPTIPTGEPAAVVTPEALYGFKVAS